MPIYRKIWFSVIVLFSLAIIANIFVVSRAFTYPFPPVKISPIKQYIMTDASGVAFGMRRLVSDIAWIELLQYYGKEDGLVHEHYHGHDNDDGDRYINLLTYCRRIVELDPFFYYVYLYGAGSLAWNEKRPDEATELLKLGINKLERIKSDITNDVHEPYWQLNLYLSAIIYKKMGDLTNMTSLLEQAVHQPHCPNMVKTILANIYQKEGKLAASLKLWLDIYESSDPTYLDQAEKKIEELRKLLKI